jgi:hypothetical protein
MSNRFSRSREIRIGSTRSRPRVVPVLLILSLLLNVYLVLTRGSGDDDPEADTALTDAVKAVAADSATPAPEVAAEVVEPTPDAVDDDDSADPDAAKALRVVIEGPVARAFVAAIGKGEGDRVALTVGRLLTWNLDVTKDPRKGDTIDLIYRVDPDDPVQIHIDAMRYKSAKFRKTFEAYLHKPEGWSQASWFDADGHEVPSRLVGSPVVDYEQITSLIGDGRKHSGMDFKAPVGTPAP